MKARTLLLLLSAVLFCTTAQAQTQEQKKGGGPDFEKFNAMRIAFITDRLDLTPAEAQEFWPVYNEYQNQKDEFRKQNFVIEKQFMDNVEEISETESAELLEKQMNLKKQELELNTVYNEKFKEVLSAKKIMKLYLSERHFKSYLLRLMRNGQGRGGQGTKGNRDDFPF